jgi:hypothetical protein
VLTELEQIRRGPNADKEIGRGIDGGSKLERDKAERNALHDRETIAWNENCESGSDFQSGRMK